MIRNLFSRTGRAVRDYDPNRLAAFERRVLEATAAKSYFSIGFVALRQQCREMLAYPGGKVSGFPDWLDRAVEDARIRVRPRRYVGADFGFPTSAMMFSFSIPLLDRARGGVGSVLFLLGQALMEMQFLILTVSGDPEYPHPDAVSLVETIVSDEREYWAKKAERVGEPLRELARDVNEIIRSGDLGDKVVLPVPFTYEGDTVNGLGMPASYRQLLCYANGIRVNQLVVLGAESLNGRLIALDSKQYFKIGEDPENLYVLEVIEGSCRDEVLALRHGARTPTRLDADVLTLCRQARLARISN